MENIKSENEIETIKLKNNKERYEFLAGYKSWPKLITNDYLGLNVYEQKLKNGFSILAFEALKPDRVETRDVKYMIFTPDTSKLIRYYGIGGSLNFFWDSANSVVEWLREHKEEI